MGIWVPKKTDINTVMLTQTAAIIKLRTANFLYWLFNYMILKTCAWVEMKLTLSQATSISQRPILVSI